jgi:hypothetical protein
MMQYLYHFSGGGKQNAVLNRKQFAVTITFVLSHLLVGETLILAPPDPGFLTHPFRGCLCCGFCPSLRRLHTEVHEDIIQHDKLLCH